MTISEGIIRLNILLTEKAVDYIASLTPSWNALTDQEKVIVAKEFGVSLDVNYIEKDMKMVKSHLIRDVERWRYNINRDINLWTRNWLRFKERYGD